MSKIKAPKIKEEWLRRLRSGEYHQTESILHSITGNGDVKDRYCCLGVLCEVVNDLYPGKVKVNDRHTAWGESRETGNLPPEIIEIVGLDGAARLNTIVEYEKNGSIEPAESLVELNDDAGFNFRQIADVIEKQF